MKARQDRLFDRMDQDLRRRIVTFLWQRRVPSVQDIAVEVTNGTVILQGKVGSFYERQLCLNCCQHVAGVLKIIDELQVPLHKYEHSTLVPDTT